MISLQIARSRRNRFAILDQLGGVAGEAVLGLAEELADEARARVIEQRDPDRPLPSALADSITVESDGYGALVRSDAPYAPYAPYVEFGTRRMAARPFLAPAAEYMRGVMGTSIANAIRKLLRGGFS